MDRRTTVAVFLLVVIALVKGNFNVIGEWNMYGSLTPNTHTPQTGYQLYMNNPQSQPQHRMQALSRDKTKTSLSGSSLLQFSAASASKPATSFSAASQPVRLTQANLNSMASFSTSYNPSQQMILVDKDMGRINLQPGSFSDKIVIKNPSRASSFSKPYAVSHRQVNSWTSQTTTPAPPTRPPTPPRQFMPPPPPKSRYSFTLSDGMQVRRGKIQSYLNLLHPKAHTETSSGIASAQIVEVPKLSNPNSNTAKWTKLTMELLKPINKKPPENTNTTNINMSYSVLIGPGRDLRNTTHKSHLLLNSNSVVSDTNFTPSTSNQYDIRTAVTNAIRQKRQTSRRNQQMNTNRQANQQDLHTVLKGNASVITSFAEQNRERNRQRIKDLKEKRKKKKKTSKKSKTSKTKSKKRKDKTKSKSKKSKSKNSKSKKTKSKKPKSKKTKSKKSKSKKSKSKTPKIKTKGSPKTQTIDQKNKRKTSKTSVDRKTNNNGDIDRFSNTMTDSAQRQRGSVNKQIRMPNSDLPQKNTPTGRDNNAIRQRNGNHRREHTGRDNLYRNPQSGNVNYFKDSGGTRRPGFPNDVSGNARNANGMNDRMINRNDGARRNIGNSRRNSNFANTRNSNADNTRSMVPRSRQRAENNVRLGRNKFDNRRMNAKRDRANAKNRNNDFIRINGRKTNKIRDVSESNLVKNVGDRQVFKPNKNKKRNRNNRNNVVSRRNVKPRDKGGRSNRNAKRRKTKRNPVNGRIDNGRNGYVPNVNSDNKSRTARNGRRRNFDVTPNDDKLDGPQNNIKKMQRGGKSNGKPQNINNVSQSQPGNRQQPNNGRQFKSIPPKGNGDRQGQISNTRPGNSAVNGLQNSNLMPNRPRMNGNQLNPRSNTKVNGQRGGPNSNREDKKPGRGINNKRPMKNDILKNYFPSTDDKYPLLRNDSYHKHDIKNPNRILGAEFQNNGNGNGNDRKAPSNLQDQLRRENKRPFERSKEAVLRNKPERQNTRLQTRLPQGGKQTPGNRRKLPMQTRMNDLEKEQQPRNTIRNVFIVVPSKRRDNSRSKGTSIRKHSPRHRARARENYIRRVMEVGHRMMHGLQFPSTNNKDNNNRRTLKNIRQDETLNLPKRNNRSRIGSRSRGMPPSNRGKSQSSRFVGTTSRNKRAGKLNVINNNLGDVASSDRQTLNITKVSLSNNDSNIYFLEGDIANLFLKQLRYIEKPTSTDNIESVKNATRSDITDVNAIPGEPQDFPNSRLSKKQHKNDKNMYLEPDYHNFVEKSNKYQKSIRQNKTPSIFLNEHPATKPFNPFIKTSKNQHRSSPIKSTTQKRYSTHGIQTNRHTKHYTTTPPSRYPNEKHDYSYIRKSLGLNNNIEPLNKLTRTPISINKNSFPFFIDEESGAKGPTRVLTDSINETIFMQTPRRLPDRQVKNVRGLIPRPANDHMYNSIYNSHAETYEHELGSRRKTHQTD